MEKDEALKLIKQFMIETGLELEKGLPDGNNSGWNYDLILLQDIANAVTAWQERKIKFFEPYCIWFFDGGEWIKKSGDIPQQLAQREWHRLTLQGTKQHNSSCETYFYVGKSNEVLKGRHPFPKEERSYRYHLPKYGNSNF